MRGRYQRRRSTRDWMLELFAWLFVGVAIVSCIGCLGLYATART